MTHKTREQQRVNPVAKHARTFNKAHTFVDRKQATKRGKVKHRGVQYNDA